MGIGREQRHCWRFANSRLRAASAVNSTASPLEEVGNVLLQRTFLPVPPTLLVSPLGHAALFIEVTPKPCKTSVY